ncbi:hypothetical protein JR316_0003065 [Psilocybe cubensis]|uniref:Uncharacterized protein n=1 Tax=Psilocybe cubensis TaxID=181762 RepID=A0ACB8H6H4_PSICU|nr:hypothetical protein JR316_0003065 [Psilocybe cubensis]KAH9483595.1 hypothetical protein JR316_0003065 [Psilocybe cubensis]
MASAYPNTHHTSPITLNSHIDQHPPLFVVNSRCGPSRARWISQDASRPCFVPRSPLCINGERHSSLSGVPTASFSLLQRRAEENCQVNPRPSKYFINQLTTSVNLKAHHGHRVLLRSVFFANHPQHSYQPPSIAIHPQQSRRPRDREQDEIAGKRQARIVHLGINGEGCPSLLGRGQASFLVVTEAGRGDWLGEPTSKPIQQALN